MTFALDWKMFKGLIWCLPCHKQTWRSHKVLQVWMTPPSFFSTKVFFFFPSKFWRKMTNEKLRQTYTYIHWVNAFDRCRCTEIYEIDHFSCRRKRIWLIIQPTISMFYLIESSSVCRVRDGELFCSQSMSEWDSTRGGPPLTMDLDTVLKS